MTLLNLEDGEEPRVYMLMCMTHPRSSPIIFVKPKSHNFDNQFSDNIIHQILYIYSLILKVFKFCKSNIIILVSNLMTYEFVSHRIFITRLWYKPNILYG